MRQNIGVSFIVCDLGELANGKVFFTWFGIADALYLLLIIRSNNIMTFREISPKINIKEIKELGKLTGEALKQKEQRDHELNAIIRGEDDRLLLIIGPCSSDNEEAVLEYARRLAKLQEEVKDKIFIVMRVYTAKPRTNGDGYKGLIHQPDSKGKPSLINGIKAVRELHYKVITETGLTTADEMLYPENLSLIDDLVSYHAIGARSVENQQHRFVASGIDVPTGMKNPTSGNLNVMFNGVYAAQNAQNFLFHYAEVETEGNPFAHAILRGGVNEYGKNIPNYYTENLLDAIKIYENMQLKNPFILIDTNHDNSGKQYLEQIRIVRQILIDREWNDKIKKYVRGFMIESYLEEGRQGEPEVFGKSITDPCLGWEQTKELIYEVYKTVAR
ncbi:3-deoxy-7-phosphoheptulonate synthase [Radiobacillus sp. PE A8.2]|uniref:3-deoxy-7-phosphoheptulonate synthase n=1 Tax=Radiobacillus sp. PE A8.2 TaxID=3380349 RepID=UPI00388EB6D1